VTFTLEQVVREALTSRGHGSVWWHALLLDEWPYVVGRRLAAKSSPLLEKSPITENGRLTIAVPNSTWAHELSLLNLRDRINGLLGRRLVREVRFEVRGGTR